jgi:hypothetical protein
MRWIIALGSLLGLGYVGFYVPVYGKTPYEHVTNKSFKLDDSEFSDWAQDSIQKTKSTISTTIDSVQNKFSDDSDDKRDHEKKNKMKRDNKPMETVSKTDQEDLDALIQSLQ